MKRLSSDSPSFFSFSRIARPEEDFGALPLYADGELELQNEGPSECWNLAGNGHRIVRNVTRPTITPYLPDPSIATGAAVLVVPGGGFQLLSIANEGWPVAEFLAERGIAAFVLKYRLNATPDDDEDFTREALKLVTAVIERPGDESVISGTLAVEDAKCALRFIRAGASEWGIDARRVSMLGFSAGALATLQTVLQGDPAEWPAAFGYVYGPMQSVSVPPSAPPMFVSLALDDVMFGAQGFGIVESWRKAERPVELHAYEKGEHAFGAGTPGTTSVYMLDQFLAWIGTHGLLQPRS